MNIFKQCEPAAGVGEVTQADINLEWTGGLGGAWPQ